MDIEVFHVHFRQAPSGDFYQAVLWTGCEQGVVICGQRRFQTHLLCRLWTSGESVCVTVQCCGQTASMELRLWTGSLHSCMLRQLHTRSFQTSACGREASEERL